MALVFPEVPSIVFDGTKLRRLRARRGLTLLDVAGALGVTDATVSRWETGRARPKHQDVLALTVLLGAGPHAFDTIEGGSLV